jgi:hypothetical protein
VSDFASSDFILADVEIYINLLNLSLNLQFVAATTTEASRAGPASPAIVTPETTSETITTGPGGGTIFLHIPL